jgi:anti-sigma regulatory factor (Ser/Thr protein kinase)
MEEAKSVELTIAGQADFASAQQCVRQMAVGLGFAQNACEEIALVVAELVSNTIRHAGKGTLRLTPLHRGGREGLEVRAEDEGPGIADVEQCFADGYSTAGSLGYGLGTVNRLMDEVDLRSAPGKGTSVVCRRWVPAKADAAGSRRWEVGVISRPRRLAAENGDAFVVNQRDDELLVGVIDGLGHGPLAQAAAMAAQRYVESHSSMAMERLFQGAGRALRGTRGAVMALARFAGEKRMTFASVGNIETRVVGSKERIALLVKRGILGSSEPHVHVQELAWEPEWALVMHSDGVRTRWQWEDFEGLEHEPARLIAAQLSRLLATDNDDATVLVVKGAAR